jgi:hypothetical protein
VEAAAEALRAAEAALSPVSGGGETAEETAN